MKKQQI